jgi:translation initiation factor 1
MAKKIKKGIVYSTNSNFEFDYDQECETLENKDQFLEAWIEKKNRNGKVACVIKGFVGSEQDLKELSKKLKSLCGVGGSTKNGEIIIQGNQRDKIMDFLKSKGYNCKRVGG